ncbi:hypothetical protein I633_22781 (plasmid) [Alteromonas mediterranea 615]|jgi:hypothetical protein|uniref:Uncharacterized protein n=1 Tax=Alteromonas mediterranea 615 TaxID=1300253 RepID=S5ALT5_9ALTE|nr:hypothetical protein I633_22781 [Alteromonas mediterranea 615]|tara:strand:- start:5560 stop:5793 length:234 start_codon:yes stop_codon:yes gene_type:complete
MPNKQKDVTLLPFVLLYTTDTFNVPDAITVYAEDSEKAEESFISAFPDASVVWIVQTASIEDAYTAYHEESAIEEAV